MRGFLRRVLFFFCRETGERSVERKMRTAYLIRGHIIQTTREPSRYHTYGRE